MILNKREKYAIAFANWCRNWSVDPMDAVCLLRRQRRAYAASHAYSDKNNPTNEKKRNNAIFHFSASASALGFDSQNCELQRNAQTIHPPAINY